MAPEYALDPMDYSKLVRYLIGPVPAAILAIALLAALFVLTEVAQHSEYFDQYYSPLLVINILGIVTLAALILVNLWRLIRQFRARVLGSRLTLRLLSVFTLIAILPLSMVYYFSVQFLDKGIDSWFDLRIEQALEDALLLGRITVDVIEQDLVVKVQKDAERLTTARSGFELVQLVDDLRERAGYSEMSLYAQSGRIIASSAQDSSSLVPDAPGEPILSKLRKGDSHSSLEPIIDNSLQIRVVVPVPSAKVNQPLRFLQVIQPLPLRYSKLGESIESTSQEYRQMEFLRSPLKISFILTLTLITLTTSLIAVWLAFYSSRRMIRPLKDLAKGTAAVSAGDYRKQLPVTSADEFGVLVQSFNDMTQQIHQAQTLAKRSQREAEDQHTYLETVLAHLSSGVLSFDGNFRLVTQNATAQQILQVKLKTDKDVTIPQILKIHPFLEPFLTIAQEGMEQEIEEWQAEVSIIVNQRRLTLMCRGTRLPIEGKRRGGYVVVFDDVTDLIQAQRDAAWGEVARRLAHEIKNPLTPIQLSAERIRRKYLDQMPESESATLDRATRMIDQQVESMKTMVNAFSNYAQPVKMEPEPIDLGFILSEVVEFHSRDDQPVEFDFNVEPDLPNINADPNRLRQVFNNLLINTLDALGSVKNPRLTIRLNSHHNHNDPYVELSFEDNGPGFPKELFDRLFEPYVTTKEKGTGLGLAIVKRIIEEHRGTLWAENPVNGGAKIVIRLPVDRARSFSATDTNIRFTRHKPVEKQQA